MKRNRRHTVIGNIKFCNVVSTVYSSSTDNSKYFLNKIYTVSCCPQILTHPLNFPNFLSTNGQKNYSTSISAPLSRWHWGSQFNICNYFQYIYDRASQSTFSSNEESSPYGCKSHKLEY